MHVLNSVFLVSKAWIDKEYFYPPPEGMLVHYIITTLPSIQFAGTHLYSLMEKSIVLKLSVLPKNTM